MKLRQSGGCLRLERPLLEKALRSNIHENVVICFFFPPLPFTFFVQFLYVSARWHSSPCQRDQERPVRGLPAAPVEQSSRLSHGLEGDKPENTFLALRRRGRLTK